MLAFDANNLYGYLMNQALPTYTFVWLTNNEIGNFNIFNTTSEATVVYILEFYLFYPSSTHDAHNGLPLVPEHLIISSEMLSPYAKELCDQFKICLPI